ncbi:MAG: PAS-domain containing protein [Pseudomonadota bacterium]
MRVSEKDAADSNAGQNGVASGGSCSAHLSEIIENIPAGLLMCDENDRVVYCNLLYRKWFFPDRQDFVRSGMPFREVLKAFASSKLCADCRNDPDWLRNRLERHQQKDEASQLQLDDGRVLRILDKSTGDGGTLSIHTDITALYEQRISAENRSKHLRLVLESINQGISMVDADLNLVAVNRHFLDLLEFPLELGREGTNFAEFVRYNAERGEYGSGDIEALVQQRVDLAFQFQAHQFERTRPDGTVIEVVGNPIAGGGMVTTYTDITDRKVAEADLLKRDEEISEQNRRFNAALDHMSQGLVMFDKDRRLMVCNRRFLEVYGLPDHMSKPDTLYDDIVRFLLERGDFPGVVGPDAYMSEMLALISRKGISSKIMKLSNGRSVRIVHQPMPNGGWVATHEDVTELHRMRSKVAHMAHHDQLTGLANRTLLHAQLEHAIARLDNDSRFAVLCVDLDRFKYVNETIGHLMGDKLLKAAAGRLMACIRSGDTIARIGGDEFAILQSSTQEPNATEMLAERICEVLAEPFDIDGHQTAIGASVGIALAPRDGKEPGQLLQNADLALYSAKIDGRGVFRFFNQRMGAEVVSRRKLEMDLRKAFERNEFELHYQPLVDLRSNAINGFEALMRWTHPKRGSISPGEFIPIAEEIGLISPLGDWIIERACMDASAWPEDKRIAVNLSPVQFQNDDLVQSVFRALAKSQLRPQRLELEITEQVLLQNCDKTLSILHALRDMGVRIVMDDFGTGYSSLSYLQRFPFDKIKIDRSFIADMSEKPETAIIVNAVASLGRDLGIAATAEGVETESQRDQVQAAGYSEMQGFLVSPARPVDEIDRMIDRDNKTKAKHI